MNFVSHNNSCCQPQKIFTSSPESSCMWKEGEIILPALVPPMSYTQLDFLSFSNAFHCAIDSYTLYNVMVSIFITFYKSLPHWILLYSWIDLIDILYMCFSLFILLVSRDALYIYSDFQLENVFWQTDSFTHSLEFLHLKLWFSKV
jgi:hypothetical protein